MGEAAARKKKQPNKRNDRKLSEDKTIAVTSTSNSWMKWVLIGGILTLTYISFSPSLKNNFTNWDDKSYVVDNELLKQPLGDCVKYFLSSFHSGNYHPLTMIVYAVEYHSAKLNPELYHSINLLLHLINVLLVFWFIFLLSGKKLEVAAIVSLFFGIHPMHVESVAWIAELKDVLYSFFFLGGLIAYYKYSTNENGKKGFLYSIIFVLFILSCLSKPAAVVFPVVLLLIDYYLKRKLNKTVWIEKLPFFILALFFGLINIKAQQSSISVVESHTMFQGFLFASYGMIDYIFKLFLPINLSPLYPFPDTNGGQLSIIYYISPFIAILLFFLVYKSLKYSRMIAFGFLFFLVNIILVLQFIPVGGAIMADRYSYIPYIGLLFIFGMWFSNFYRSGKKNFAAYKSISIIVLIILALTSVYFTKARCKIWENPETIWTSVINNYPDNWQGYLGRGEFLMNTAKYNINPKPENIDKAFEDFNQAISKNKDNDPHVFLDRGLIYAMKGKPDSALADYNRTLKLGYHDYQIYMALGTTYSGIHKYDSAYKYFDIVVKMHGEDAQLLQNRAYTFLMDGKFKESVRDYSQLINNGGNDASFYFFRGCAYHSLENLDGALNDYSKAIEINPNYAQAYSNRSLIYEYSKKYKDALNDILKAQSLGLNVDTIYISKLKTNLQ